MQRNSLQVPVAPGDTTPLPPMMGDGGSGGYLGTISRMSDEATSSSTFHMASTKAGTTEIDMKIRSLMARQGNRGFRLLQWCKGNPLSETGKRQQMLKLMFMTLVPILALTIITVLSMVKVQQSNSMRTKIRDMIKFSMETGTVIHFLQRERDMTALHLTSQGAETRLFLRERYPATDTALEKLSMWPEKSADGTLGQFATVKDFQKFLRKHRFELNSIKTKPYDEISFYTKMIRSFIDVVYNYIQESKDGDQWREMVAYQLLIISKEDMGVERTLGGVFFAQGQFDTFTDYLWYQEKHTVGVGNFAASKRFSELVGVVFEQEQEKVGNNFSVSIDRMRQEIARNNASSVSLEMSTWWFDNMTIFIDIMFQVQLRLAERILTNLERSLTRDNEQIAIGIGLFCLSLIIAPFCIFSIRGIIQDVQNYAYNLSSQTKRLSQERHRTEAILYRLLPRSIADQLKKGQRVEPEAYEESSIFFSDIVGFTKISSACVPVQVVNMLNRLYMCFDSRIELYDVYKVETIGDAYMVSSGVPKRNGQRHAQELATMALDLIHHVTHLEIPHLPGQRMTLRAGMHSGPCVAGVVGIKMPRYCLFGSTVNTASRMEQTGEAGKLHMSEQSRNYLINDIKFKMQPRGKIEIAPGRVECTYWLTEKDGLVSSFKCWPKCIEDPTEFLAELAEANKTQTIHLIGDFNDDPMQPQMENSIDV